MPKRIIECEPWCEEHNDDSQDESCVTACAEFGPPLKGDPKFRQGTLWADQWEGADEPTVWIEFIPGTAPITIKALRSMHAALIQCPGEFRDAVDEMVKKLSEVSA